MNLETIFRYAHETPGNAAIFERGQRVTYREFAFWIDWARRYLEQQAIPPGTTAVLAGIKCRLDGWAFAIALRSLGLTTLSIGSLEELSGLGIPDIGCVITTSAGDPPLSPAKPGCKLIRIGEGLFLGREAGPVPGLPTIDSPPGGHIRLTSGTTGTRKKVLLDHPVIVAGSFRRADIFSFSNASVANVLGFAMWTGIGFFVPCSAWAAGGAVVFHLMPDTQRSTLDLSTHLFTVPKTLLEFLQAPPLETRKNDRLELSCAGGALTPALYSAAKTSLTSRISTAISSTEVGLWAFTRIESPEDLISHRILPSAEVQIVDDDDLPVATGQAGGVRIRTTGITGYLGEPEATAAYFRNGYFYSGDLGSFRADGRLVLHGRRSNVINVLGQKLSAEVLEQGLQNRLGVEGVCVFAAPGENDIEQLHIGIESQRPIGSDEIAIALNSELGRAEAAVIHFMKAIPRNDTGKIDRAALKRMWVMRDT